MKIQEGDYVDVSGMNEAERREVVQALLDCGVDVGEGFDFCDSLSMKTICVDKDGIFHDFGRSFKGRKLTLSDLHSPEWDGNSLPPVGVECLGDADSRPNGFEPCFVIHVDESAGDLEHKAVALFKTKGDERYTEPEWCSDFKPLKTESQREREELYSLVDKAYMDGAKKHSGGLAAITDALIKAGYKKDTNL